MAEPDIFERRVADAVRAYATEMPTRVDAATVADRVAGERAHARWRALSLLAAAALLLLAAAAGVVIGGRILDTQPRTFLQPTGIEVLTPESTGYDRVVVDGTGAYWAIGLGHVTRFDPTTGERETWTLSDDAAFGSGAAGPAASGGVWAGIGPKEDSVIRRFDGTAFRETIPTPCSHPYCGRIEVALGGTIWHGLDRWDGSAWVAPPAGGPDPMGDVLARDGDDAWVSDVNDPTTIWHLADGQWSSHRLPVDGPAFSDYSVLTATAGGGSAWITSREDQDGRVFRFDGQSWAEMARTGLRIWELTAAAPDGSVWAVVDAGAVPAMMRYADGRWTTHGAAEGLVGSPTGAISATPAGVFVGTDRGLLRFNGDGWVPAWSDAHAGPATAQRIAAVSRDEAWVADGRALWHYRDGRWDGPRAPADMAMLDAEEIAVGPDGAVWMTAEDGVAVLANGTWTSIATEGAPGTLAVDADATAWVPAGDGSAGEVLAINRDPAVPIRRFSCPNPVGSLAAASDGSIYVAGEPASPSQSGGLSRISGTACTPVDPVGDGGTHGVQGIASGPSGSLAAVVLVPAEPVPAAQGATAQEAAAQDTPAPSTAARTDEPSGAVAWEAPAEAGPTVAVTMLYDGTRWTEIDRSETLEVEVFFDPQGRLWRSRDDRFEHLDGTHWVSGDLEVGPGGMDLSIAPDGTYWLVGWGSEVYRIQAER